MYSGKIIKKLRFERNINQTELAEILGITQNNISSYETDRTRPSFEILEKIADYFGVSIDYLFEREKSTMSALSENENYIVETFRNLRPETQIEFSTTVSMVKALRDTQKRIEGKWRS